MEEKATVKGASLVAKDDAALPSPDRIVKAALMDDKAASKDKWPLRMSSSKAWVVTVRGTQDIEITPDKRRNARKWTRRSSHSQKAA